MEDREARRFYAIARGSALQCAAIVDALAALQFVPGDQASSAHDLLERIVSMLTRMARVGECSASSDGCGRMGLRQPSPKQGPQGLLPFDFEASDNCDEVTGRAGLPLLLETMLALRVGQAVKQQVKLRKRNAGFSEAERVEDLVLLLGAGGECLDDLAILAADKGLVLLCGRNKLPSPDAARAFLLGFHDEKLLSTARSENQPSRAPGFAGAQALGQGRPESAGTRRLAARPGATTHRLGGLNAPLGRPSGRHSRTTSLGCQPTTDSPFPRSARPECPATATLTTTTTLRCPAGRATSP